jgi:hypothetical protein
MSFVIIIIIIIIVYFNCAKPLEGRFLSENSISVVTRNILLYGHILLKLFFGKVWVHVLPMISLRKIPMISIRKTPVYKDRFL